MLKYIMNIVYSFIGKLPEYTIHSIHQTRTFFKGKIYLIVDNINDNLLDNIKKYDVTIINYNTVVDKEIIKYHRRFNICHCPGRELLFFRSTERFFLVKNLIKLLNLENVLFIEIDNLLYNDPNVWLQSLSKFNFSLMYTGKNHLSSGICFIKNFNVIQDITQKIINFINSEESLKMPCLNEMKILYSIKNTIDGLHLLPGIWENDSAFIKEMYENYELYNSIFDPGSIGTFLFGNEPANMGGKIVKGLQLNKYFSDTYDYSKHKIEFHLDEKARKIPYIINDNCEKIRINILHIYSKDLVSALSKDMLN